MTKEERNSFSEIPCAIYVHIKKNIKRTKNKQHNR